MSPLFVSRIDTNEAHGRCPFQNLDFGITGSTTSIQDVVYLLLRIDNLIDNLLEGVVQVITVQDYATKRGCSRQTVYNAIRRHDVKTEQGVANGKSAQYLDDEAVQRLDQLIKPTQKELTVLSDSINMEIIKAERQAEQEASKRVETALREKSQKQEELTREVVETRKQMVQTVSTEVSRLSKEIADMRADYQKIIADMKADYQKEIAEKDAELEKKRKLLLECADRMQELSDRLKQADKLIADIQGQLEQKEYRIAYLENHPIKAWNEKRKEKKNG